MQLTRHTEYALRALLNLATRENGPVTVPQLASELQVSHHHLAKVCRTLSRRGFLRTLRGRTGGVVLAMEPNQIRLGQVVRSTEAGIALRPLLLDGPARPHLGSAEERLGRHFDEAQEQFLTALDKATIADLVEGATTRVTRISPEAPATSEAETKDVTIGTSPFETVAPAKSAETTDDDAPAPLRFQTPDTDIRRAA